MYIHITDSKTPALTDRKAPVADSESRPRRQPSQHSESLILLIINIANMISVYCTVKTI